LPPRSFDQGIDYFNSLVETNLASRMAAGTVRAYQQATTLHLVPVTLIGVAISTAAFPKMTERLGQGRPDLFRKELQAVLRVIVWLALPTAMITYFTRGYLVHFIKNGGEPLIAGILGILSVAILFRSIYHISARSFYAKQDTKTPLYISIGTISLNIILAIYFTAQLNLGAYGLAWAQSIVSIVEVAALFVIMSRRIPGLFNAIFVHAVARMLSATGFTALITYISVNIFSFNASDQSFLAAFPKFVAIVAISAVAYTVISKLLGLGEANAVSSRVMKFIFKQYRPKSR
jgi:putative peptidoglycan lipid II flippase